MAARLEALAAFYREKGWDKAAKLLEAEAEIFRAAGMPDEFSTSPSFEIPNSPREPFQVHKKALIKLFDGRKFPSKNTLTLELASEINQVGQKIEDTVPLDLFPFKGKGTYAEFDLPGQPRTEEEQAYTIDPHLSKQFNVLINTLSRAGFETGLTQTKLVC